MNISNVSTVIIRDKDGNLVKRFRLGSATISKLRGGDKTLELNELKE